MMVLCDEVLCVLHLTERLRVTIVWHTAEGAIWDWLKVSISTEGSVMLMFLFVTVPLTPDFVGVSRLWYSVLDSVLVNHLNIYY